MTKTRFNVREIARKVAEKKAIEISTHAQLDKTARMTLALSRRLMKYQALPESKRERFRKATDPAFFRLLESLKKIGCIGQVLAERLAERIVKG